MEYLEFVKAQKELWFKATGANDMPPFVIGEREEKPVLIVMPPRVDKWLAVNAAELLRRGMCCDAITIITDGYCISKDTATGIDNYIRYQELKHKYDGLDEAFKAGEKDVVETLTAFRYSSDGKMNLGSIEYRVKEGKIVWSQVTEMKEEEGAKVGGNIPDALRKIMSLPTILQESKTREAAARENLTTEEQIFYSGRAVRKLFTSQNFLVMDCVPWSQEEGYGVLLSRMMEKFDEVGNSYDFKTMKYNPSMN